MITFERPPLDYLILLKGGDNSKKKVRSARTDELTLR